MLIIDLSARFGHNVGGVITKTINVTDGTLDIVFLHGSVQNPLINAIEILSIADSSTLKIAPELGNEKNQDAAKLEINQGSDDSVLSIKIFPNPANAEVYLQSPNPSVEITNVAVYAYGGRYLRTYSTGRDII